MSSSELYIINKELKAAEIINFQNSWLFTPAICTYLINKYAPDEDKQAAIKQHEQFGNFDFNREKPINFLTYFTSDGDNWGKINDAINDSTSLIDRIGWELTNQQMFRSSDKNIISSAIKELQKLAGGDADRFKEIADSIEKIDPENTPFFIFKNTTVDDGVEKYFSIYDEEIDDCKEISLKEYPGELQFDFVVIENGEMSFKVPLECIKEVAKEVAQNA